MDKYVFKNPEVEKALRFVAKELGYSDEDFDQQVEIWSNGSTIWIMGEGREDLDFPSSLLKKVKEFDPNGWNDADVEPPRHSHFKDKSPVMLLETPLGIPYKAFFDFDVNVWVDNDDHEVIPCKRYRLYPAD